MISSQNGGPFTNSNRYIDFDIPANHLIDMSQCFVQLECSITPATQLTTLQEIVNLILVNDPNITVTPMNIDLIKNCSLSSQKKSLRLEDIRKVNVLRHNLLELSQTTSEKLSHPDSLSQVTTFDNKQLNSGFTQLTKVGSLKSSYVNNMLRIPLSHLFQLGSVKVFDTNKLGICRVHLELDNLNNFKVDLANNVDVEEQICENISSAGSDELNLQRAYDTLEYSPWYVGMAVTVSYTTGDGEDSYNTTILSIEYDYENYAIILTLALGLGPLDPGDQYTFVTVRPLTYSGVAVKGTFNILQASLGIAYNDMVQTSPMDMMEYLTWTTEEYSANSQYMHKIFEVEPNAVNCFLMFQDPSNQSLLISNNNAVINYRMRVDNDDVYNRDINVNNIQSNDSFSHDPLHYDSLLRTFVNANLTFKNLKCASLTYNAHNDDTEGMLSATNNQILIIASPLPESVASKKVQFDIACGMGLVKNVILYKQVIKTVNMN